MPGVGTAPFAAADDGLASTVTTTDAKSGRRVPALPLAFSPIKTLVPGLVTKHSSQKSDDEGRFRSKLAAEVAETASSLWPAPPLIVNVPVTVSDSCNSVSGRKAPQNEDIVTPTPMPTAIGPEFVSEMDLSFGSGSSATSGTAAEDTDTAHPPLGSSLPDCTSLFQTSMITSETLVGNYEWGRQSSRGLFSFAEQRPAALPDLRKHWTSKGPSTDSPLKVYWYKAPEQIMFDLSGGLLR